MRHNQSFKVGDKIIDQGQVYRIFKIKEERNSSGENEKIIYYRPYMEGESHKFNAMICSIPIKNVSKIYIRKPISKDKLRDLLDGLSEEADIDGQINTNQLRELLRLNDIHSTIQVLRILWADKNNKSINFTRLKQDVFSLAMDLLIEEIAFVEGVSYSKARQEIENALEKGRMWSSL